MDNEDLFGEIKGKHFAIVYFFSSVRQSFYGMTKEVSNLIKENNELLETK